MSHRSEHRSQRTARSFQRLLAFLLQTRRRYMSAAMIAGLAFANLFYFQLYSVSISETSNAKMDSTAISDQKSEGQSPEAASGPSIGDGDSLRGFGSRQVSDSALLSIARRADRLVAAIDSSERRAEIDSLLQVHGTGDARVWRWILSLAVLGVIIVGLWEVRKYTANDEEVEQDRDPDELREHFTTYQHILMEFDNPRQLKRLSNKIRLQYRLLKNDSRLSKAGELSLFFQLMLALEHNRAILLLEYKEFDEKLRKEWTKLSDGDFNNEYQRPLLTSPDGTALIRKLYELNRHSLV